MNTNIYQLMKKVLLLLIIVISVSCKNEAKKDVKTELL